MTKVTEYQEILSKNIIYDEDKDYYIPQNVISIILADYEQYLNSKNKKTSTANAYNDGYIRGYEDGTIDLKFNKK